MSIRNKPMLILGATALAVLIATLAVVERHAASGASAESSFATRFQPVAPVIAGIGSTRTLTPVPLEVEGSTPTNDRKPPPNGRAHHEPADASR